MACYLHKYVCILYVFVGESISSLPFSLGYKKLYDIFKEDDNTISI